MERWVNQLLSVMAGTALLTLGWLVAPSALISIDSDATAKIVFNDNREPAGTLSSGVLQLDLEIREGDWNLVASNERKQNRRSRKAALTQRSWRGNMER